MSLRINDTVPNFHAVTDQGEIDLSELVSNCGAHVPPTP